ncbi:hypothetical protein CCANI_05450 [Corynebacterium canis]|nr:hypothetical protein CCANI_05450 [Corynebacterium canis]
MGPAKSASGRSDTAVSPTCGSNFPSVSACRICLSAELGSRFNPPNHAGDGLRATADLGSSFYSSFGGLTKKFRTNLGQKRCKWSFYSSLTTLMKKFRTIAGQRLHTTYRRKLPGEQSRAITFELSRIMGPATFASGRSDTAVSCSCENMTPSTPACRICLSGGSWAGVRSNMMTKPNAFFTDCRVRTVQLGG